MVTQSQASKIRRALIKTDRLSDRQHPGNLVTQSHGSKVTASIVTMIARPPPEDGVVCSSNDAVKILEAHI
jgi:hypothetical protein